MGIKEYVRSALATYISDPASTRYQQGYLAALLAIADFLHMITSADRAVFAPQLGEGAGRNGDLVDDYWALVKALDYASEALARDADHTDEEDALLSHAYEALDAIKSRIGI